MFGYPPLSDVRYCQLRWSKAVLRRAYSQRMLVASGWRPWVGGGREDETPYWIPPQEMVHFLPPARESPVTQKISGNLNISKDYVLSTGSDCAKMASLHASAMRR